MKSPRDSTWGTSTPKRSRSTLMGVATPRLIITAAEMDKVTPQQRADAVDSATIRAWDDVP